MIGLMGIGIGRFSNEYGAQNYTQVEKTKRVMDLKLPEKNPLKASDKVIKFSTSAKKIVLEKKNTLVLRGPVQEESVARLQLKLLAMSQDLPADTPIFLVLDSPGGSVFAGMALIDHFRAIPQPVHTVTLFAASMAFQIAQNMDIRYITNSGTLMSHRAKLGGLGGQLDGEFESRYQSIKRAVDYLDAIASKRMGIDISEYKQKIFNEYWVFGFDAPEEKAADFVASVNCGTSLSGITKESLDTPFGTVKVKFSECPLIRGPLELGFDDIEDENHLLLLKKAINMMFSDKAEYVREYIINNRHFEVFTE